MADDTESRSFLDALAFDVTAERRTALHAVHVLEYALNAPAPRRHRTWLPRVIVAIDALHVALEAQIPSTDSVGLLDEIALSHPDYFDSIEALRQESLNLTIAVASLREQLEPEPTIDVDPTDVRDRLSTITHRFRQHQANEADLVYQATGIELDPLD